MGQTLGLTAVSDLKANYKITTIPKLKLAIGLSEKLNEENDSRGANYKREGGLENRKFWPLYYWYIGEVIRNGSGEVIEVVKWGGKTKWGPKNWMLYMVLHGFTW